MLASEHVHGIQTYIFYKDIRAIGKGFQEYVDRARDSYGVIYINAIPGEIRENSETKNPILVYENPTTKAATTMEVDMVVLATTLTPRKGVEELSKVLGIELDAHHFFKTLDKVNSPLDTKVPGIFLAGYCESPKDIPDSVAQGSGAAARACEALSLIGGE